MSKVLISITSFSEHDSKAREMLEENNIELICNFLGTTNKELVSSTINNFDLFIVENGCIYNQRVSTQLYNIAEKSKKAKENANKRWEKEQEMKNNEMSE